MSFIPDLHLIKFVVQKQETMTGLALQIDGKWAVLSEGDSVNIENNSPVWGEGNSFSLPFELDIEANRHILGNADQITGQSVYEVLDGKRAVLYTLGIPVYYGKIKMEDEVELSEGKVDVTLVSGNLTFDEMIDGMNCQDVELLDEIVVGRGISSFQGENRYSHKLNTLFFPKELMAMKVGQESKVNVTNSYPISKYCNVRIAYQLPERPTTQSEASKIHQENETKYLEEIVKKGTIADYVVLDADRPLSGLCFFVLYFLDCLFAKLGIMFDSSQISNVEDMNRLAFFSTKCSCTLKRTSEYGVRGADIRYTIPSFYSYGDDNFYSWTRRYWYSLYIADSKNFPNVEVSEVIASMENGFGVRFIHDAKSNFAKAIYVKDVLMGKDVCSINAIEIHEVHKTENNIKGLKLTYSGNEDNTSYNYNDWTNINDTLDYSEMKQEVSSANKSLYIDPKTGNAYRVKVDEDAETEEELNPTLVEVAEFIPVEYGDCSEENNTETVEIPFTPIIQNDVYNGEEQKQTFATFLDLSMQYPSYVPLTTYYFKTGDQIVTEAYFGYSYFSAQRSDGGDDTWINVGVGKQALKKEQSNSLFDYEVGLTLGIMRGPGREAGTEDYEQNYDGENNFKYVTVGQDYVFHNDTTDNYGNLFDYNGEISGGVGTSGRFSLKLRAEKPIPESLKEIEGTYEEYYAEHKEMEWSDEDIKSSWDELVAKTEFYKNNEFFPITETYAQRRGLFDKFYSEYAYFVVNRKIVRMKCRMEMADLLNIDWTKRYKIGEYVGFINKYSYSVSSTGISDVELEMYYI